MNQLVSKRVFAIPALLVLLGGALLVSNSSISLHAEDGGEKAQKNADSAGDNVKIEKATFGSGCFWCTEAVFEELKGVHAAVSGYSGGKIDNPTYKQVCTGFTGHAEVVQIDFDPAKISFEELLEVFWKTHDPTTLNRQGADTGTQYRSVVFYHSDEQKQLAEEIKAKLDKSGAFEDPIVTEISPAEKFYPAEDYHQAYFELNGRQPYCRAVIQPKMEKFRKAFADKLSKKDKKMTADVDWLPEDTDWSKVDWKERLSPEQYHVAREEGTERPFQNAYWDNKQAGIYHCVCCGLPLYSSEAKYKSGTGWPSFFQPLDKKNVTEVEDRGFFTTRTEIQCSRCEAHLGHVFTDGPKPTGLRYCMNSAAMRFFEGEDESSDTKDQ